VPVDRKALKHHGVIHLKNELNLERNNFERPNWSGLSFSFGCRVLKNIELNFILKRIVKKKLSILESSEHLDFAKV
jgi:hypothetical protein